jgi:short-subunit dehydrogenase
MTKTALVTGSTSGIGKAFASKLAAEKHDLILVSRDTNKLSTQSAELSKKYGIETTYIPLDLTENGAAQKVFDTVSNQGLSVQILINNAGFNNVGHFIHTDLQKENDMINLHVTLTTEMMKYFLPDMVKNGYGRVLNLGSTGSYIPCPLDAVYAATKAYIFSVSKGINAELNGTGVSVTVLCPGSTNTEFARKAGIDKSLLFSLFVMEPDIVANIGYKALMKGKAAVIAGLYNKLQVFSSKIIPSFIIIPLTKKMLKV